MQMIIAGSRNFRAFAPTMIFDLFVHFGICQQFVVLCGGAPGIDQLGKEYAEVYRLPLIEMPADWEKHGRAAGPIRNKAMAKEADMLLLIWDGKSRGSASMKYEMKKLNKPVYEVIINNFCQTGIS